MQPRKLSHGILKTWFLPLRDIFSIATQRKSSRSGIYILMLNMEGCPQHLNLEISGIFSGNLSMDFTEDSKWKMKMSRSGFCGMQSKKFDGFIDLDAYNTISLKVKGDGRCYISTIYTENWVNSPGQEEDNSWQAFVFVPKDNWYIAKAFVYFGELYSVVSKFRFCVMVTKY